MRRERATGLVNAVVSNWGRSPGLINSIQYVSVTPSGASLTTDTTINAVTVADTVVLFLGLSADNDANAARMKVALTSTTNIQFTVNTSPAFSTLTAKAVVIEFKAGFIKTNQDFEIALTGVASGTVTISAVAVANTMIIPRGWTVTATSQAINMTGGLSLTLTNTTTVTGARQGTTGNVALAGTALEFN